MKTSSKLMIISVGVLAVVLLQYLDLLGSHFTSVVILGLPIALFSLWERSPSSEDMRQPEGRDGEG